MTQDRLGQINAVFPTKKRRRVVPEPTRRPDVDPGRRAPPLDRTAIRVDGVLIARASLRLRNAIRAGPVPTGQRSLSFPATDRELIGLSIRRREQKRRQLTLEKRPQDILPPAPYWR